MVLMKLTADDANFQNYIKNQTNYTFSQVSWIVSLSICRLKDARKSWRTSIAMLQLQGTLLKTKDRIIARWWMLHTGPTQAISTSRAAKQPRTMLLTCLPLLTILTKRLSSKSLIFLMHPKTMRLEQRKKKVRQTFQKASTPKSWSLSTRRSSTLRLTWPGTTLKALKTWRKSCTRLSCCPPWNQKSSRGCFPRRRESSSTALLVMVRPCLRKQSPQSANRPSFRARRQPWPPSGWAKVKNSWRLSLH